MLRLDDFRHIVPDDVLAGIFGKARGLYGKHVVNVNSTYHGGGVAAILESLVPLINDVGIDCGWRILHGSMDFFEVTKEFHNALQGGPIELTEEKKQLYMETNENFGRFTHFDHDCVIVHDPQPLPLILSYRKGQPWVWRCHIDLTEPNPDLWDHVKGILLKYDQVIVSSRKYLKTDLPVEQRIVMPAINPLTHRNCDLDRETVDRYLRDARVPTDRPLLTQVSRLDPWKDPIGVIDVFERVRQRADCRLLLCHNVASDDPEALRVATRVRAKAEASPFGEDILFVEGNNATLVNAIQRASSVIIQKSTREGFCLAVTEALWKGTPVVASNVGGIPAQIEDGRTGYLLDPLDFDGFADRIVHLLEHRDETRQMGHAARESVRERFLITRLLSDYLDLLNDLIGPRY